MYQARHIPLQTYLESFQNQLEVIRHIGGANGDDPAMLDRSAKLLRKTQSTLSKSKIRVAQDEYVAIAFLTSSSSLINSKMITYKGTLTVIPRI
jgi:hypothetical protein